MKTILLIIIVLFTLSGCSSSTIKNMHDERFTTGCAVVNAGVKLGYLNQEGNAEACKLVCSPDLPKNFNYSYEDVVCKVHIGATNE